MDIGIGLPNAVPGVGRAGIVDWARRAEAAGFPSVATLDRIAYGNYESFVALAAAAAVTERIRLATDILIAPLRANTALLAKQALTIDHLAGGGRVVLGLAVGGREDDFALSGVDFAQRGRIFDRQLEALGRFWDGEEAWRAEGRDGEPRTRALFYFALGSDAEGAARRSLGNYYSFLGEYADRIVDSAAKDEDTVRGYLAAYKEAGCDEVICFPASDDPEQVDLLARAAL